MKITPDMNKPEIRKLAEKIRSSIQEDEKLELNKRIYTHLFNWPLFKEANHIFCYISFRSEINTFPILEKIIKEGKVLSVPKINREIKEMKAMVLKDIKTELKPGVYGILEPVETCPEADYSSIDLIITPGLVFTLDGKRLGYGGGYYDRFLAKHSGIPTCALTYDRLIADSLPVKESDIDVDYLITETGIKITKKGKKL